jgi:hypothetical protein
VEETLNALLDAEAVSMGAELSANVGFQFSLVGRHGDASVISRYLDRLSSFRAGERGVSMAAS